MALNIGYKRTETGIAPLDWKVAPLGEYVKITSGSSPSVCRISNDGVPYFKVEQLGNSEKYLQADNTPYQFECRNTVPGNSVIFAKRGAAIALNKIRILKQMSFMDTNLMSLLPQEGLDCEYLYYALGHIGLWRFADTTSVPQINNKHVNPLPFPLPSVPEQRAITGALSDADAWIESLEQLIAKKRQINQGAMQELLTGQTRLPGFSGEWARKPFGEIAQVRLERVDPRQTGPFEFCVELEHIEQRTGRLLSHSTTTDTSSLKSVFRSGDVLFGKLRAYLRKFWIADRSGVCSTEIWVLAPRAGLLDQHFLLHIVTVDRFIEAASTAYGTHMPRSDWNVVKNYEVPVPPLPEQQAIAAILSDMDAEIDALGTKLAKARQIKQGMMQELLTGRIRLV